MSKAVLNREALLAALAIRTKDVAIPGGTVRVRTMTAGERISLGATAVDANGKIDAKAYSAQIVASSVIGEDGFPVFSTDDAELLLAGAADVFETLFDACQELSGLGNKAKDAAKGN